MLNILKDPLPAVSHLELTSWGCYLMYTCVPQQVLFLGCKISHSFCLWGFPASTTLQIVYEVKHEVKQIYWFSEASSAVTGNSWDFLESRECIEAGESIDVAFFSVNSKVGSLAYVQSNECMQIQKSSLQPGYCTPYLSQSDWDQNLSCRLFLRLIFCATILCAESSLCCSLVLVSAFSSIPALFLFSTVQFESAPSFVHFLNNKENNEGKS